MCVLDPHAHLTDKMIKNASVMSFMKEYPHTDGLDRWQDLLNILDNMLVGSVIPTPAVVDCEIIGFWPTNKQPIRDLTDKFYIAEEHGNILTTSFIHGFPWGDTPDTGSKVLVYSDNDKDLATSLAKKLASQVIDIKEASQPLLLSIDDAIDKMLATQGLVALADMADNPGGGSPADSTFILHSLLERKVTNVAMGLIYDPELVKHCFAIGINGKIESRLGGKLGRFSGEPIDFTGMIKGLRQNAVQPFASFGDVPMGDSIWIQIEGIDVVVTSKRSQIFSPLALSVVGLDITQHKGIVVKSSNHFYDGFKNIISEVFRVSTHGCLSMDFCNFVYEKLNKHRWPLRNIRTVHH
jgi:microcystin degradation protein MlrC